MNQIRESQESGILVVIPARSGSKEIPDKNIRKCNGITLLERAVRLAKEIPIKKRIVISTDSEKYIKTVEGLIDGPYFYRPGYLSGDRIGDIEVLIHALHTSENMFKEMYSCVVLLPPTSPLRELTDVVKCINEVVSGNADSCMTVNTVDTKFHPLKSIAIDEDGRGKIYLKEGESIISRQQLGQTYIRNGGAYAIKPLQLCRNKTFFTENLRLIITKEMISIDTLEDLKRCERILKTIIK